MPSAPLPGAAFKVARVNKLEKPVEFGSKPWGGRRRALERRVNKWAATGVARAADRRATNRSAGPGRGPASLVDTRIVRRPFSTFPHGPARRAYFRPPPFRAQNKMSGAREYHSSSRAPASASGWPLARRQETIAPPAKQAPSWNSIFASAGLRKHIDCVRLNRHSSAPHLHLEAHSRDLEVALSRWKLHLKLRELRRSNSSQLERS